MSISITLLITISICCCVAGFLMWFFLKCYKKTSIYVLLFSMVLFIVRFLYPFEFPFTYSIYVTKGYPDIYIIFETVFSIYDSFQITLGQLLILIWILGSLISVFHLFSSYVSLQRTISSLHDEQNPSVLLQLDHILNEKKFTKKHFRIKKSNSQNSPFVTGFLHPVIVIPDISLSEKEWYYILSHETAHYLHGDTLYKLLIEILCVIFWWNPLFYYLRKQIAICIEECADLIAVDDLTASEKLEYQECLLTVAKQCRHAILPASAILSFDGYCPGELKRRIALVTKSISTPLKAHSKLGMYGIMTALLLVTFLSYGIVVEPKSTATPPDEPDSFTIPADNSYAVKINDSLYELYIDDEFMGTFQDMSNVPEMPVYEKEEMK